MRKVTGLLVIAVALLASCAGVPREDLTLDLTGADMPVMLSVVDTQAKTMVFTFKSGYSSLSVSSTSSFGGVTVTATATAQTSLGTALRTQLQPTLTQNPAWLAVDGLSFKVDKYLDLYSSSHDYILTLDLKTPIDQ